MIASLIVVSCLLIGIILQETFEVMLLPRRIRRKLRPVRLFFNITWAIWSAIGKRLKAKDWRDTFLSLYGPLSMVFLLFLWGVGLILGFGTLQWALQQHIESPPGLLEQLYFSAVTFFTLGYGDITPQTGPAKVVAVAEAGTGFGLLAIVIGYLPVLYQLFSKRESLVILLDARAGSPPTATTLLCRHGEGSNFENLNSFLGEWEQWAAEIVESHLSYPMLSYYRSQHDNESWLTALAAVMDACALALVGIKGISTFQARMTFATANLAITELGRVFNVQPENFAKDRLPSTSFSAMRARLEAAGLFFLDDEMAEAKLLDFRSTYEPLLNGLSQYFLLDLPAWCASDKQLDNWQHGSGGRMAKELVEAAPSGAE